MPALLPLFVRLNGEVRGPFTPEQLGQLAEVGAITAETEVSTSAAGPLVRLQEFPACAALLSGCLGSEAKAFETVNGPTGHPVELRELMRLKRDVMLVGLRYRLELWDKSAWDAAVRRVMQLDFSWQGPSAKYLAAYRRVLGKTVS